jgi:hypothetical protein
MILESYCDYCIENWTSLESGNYKNLDKRP